jgi:hypothetical protein
MRIINQRGQAVSAALGATAFLAIGQTAIAIVALAAGYPTIPFAQLLDNLALTGVIGAGIIGVILFATRGSNDAN